LLRRGLAALDGGKGRGQDSGLLLLEGRDQDSGLLLLEKEGVH